MAGTIYKRGPKTWQIRFSKGTDHATGKRMNYCETVYGSKQDASAVLAKRYREFTLTRNGHDEFIVTELTTLDKFLDSWLSDTAKKRVAETTYAQYELILRTYVRPAIGGKMVSHLSTTDVERLYNRIMEAGLSSRTVRYVHAVLRSALDEAVAKKMLTSNPCIGRKLLPKMTHREMKAFSKDEAHRFVQSAEKNRHNTLFLLALDSGMRPEEYLALKWTDVDFERNTVSVQRTMIRRSTKNGGWYFGKPKTVKSRRTIRISPYVCKKLRAHKVEQAKQILLLGSEYERNELIFANEFGRPLDIKNLRTRHFSSILEEAKLEGFRLYDLRHSMATLMLANGENPKVVSERLGHASITLTLDIYSHVLPDMQEAASKRLTKVLFG